MWGFDILQNEQDTLAFTSAGSSRFVASRKRCDPDLKRYMIPPACQCPSPQEGPCLAFALTFPSFAVFVLHQSAPSHTPYSYPRDYLSYPHNKR